MLADTLWRQYSSHKMDRTFRIFSFILAGNIKLSACSIGCRKNGEYFHIMVVYEADVCHLECISASIV
ncbi:hypothetical protein GDO78_008913 [Eleutherodactylus coqui]|uniref:Uncharacterized protein n=1 Tax=Eleutherodactylus coqui TaxID=57060 RepID=A0A8J6FDJ9_ELECQ|nr:hypothetical protein GDO78_008913 [Eleutherodactylus coqui]